VAALGRLVAELALDSAQFTEGLRRAQKGFDDFEKSLGKAALGAVTSFAGQLIALETASKVADAAISAFTDTVKGLSALDDAAEKTGATVESLAKLQAQAVVSGQAFEVIEGALIKLNKGLLNADDETKSAGAALEKLGIQARGANGELKDSGAIVFEVSKKFAEFSDKGPGKAALAMDLFGKSGAQLLPLLKDLADSGDINVKVTEAQAQAADDYEKNIQRLAAQKLELKRVIVSEVLPAANEFLTAILDLKKNGDGLAATIKQLADDGSLAKWARDGAVFIGELIDKTTYGINQFRALAKDLEGVAYAGKAILDTLAAGAARAAGQIGASLELTAQARENEAKANLLFAESERIASAQIKTYTNAISAQTGAFDDARDRAVKLAAATDNVTKATLNYAGATKKGKDEAAEFAKTLESLLAKVEGKDLGVDSDFTKNIEAFSRALKEAFAKGNTDAVTRLSAALHAYAMQQPVNIKLTKEMEEATKDLAKAAEEEYKLMLKNVPEISTAYEDLWTAMQKQLEASDEELRLFGLTGTAREKALVDIKLQIALTKDLTETEKQALITQAEKLKASIDARGQSELSAKSLEEQLKNTQQIQDNVAGFFEDLFLNGKKAFENLGQTVKQFFAKLASQMAAKYVLNIGANLFSGGGSGGLNLGSLFSGGTGGGGFDLGSIFGGGGSLLGQLPFQFGAGPIAGGTGLAGLASSLGLESFATGLASAGAGLTANFATLGTALSGGIAAAGGFAAVLGAAIPVIGIIAGIASALGVFDDETGIKIDNSVRDGRGRKDIIDSALGQFDVSGDIGNDAFQPLIDRVNQLDSFIADNLFSPEVLAVVRDNIQRISSDMTDWFGFDDEASAKIAIEKSSKLFLQQRYSIAFNALEEGAGDLITSFQGSADELLVYIDKLARSAFAIKQLNLAVPGLNLSIAAFSELTETAQEAFTVLALSLESFVTDTNQTVADLIEASTRGAVTAYLDQADALLDLRDGLANGTVSIEDFAAGVGNLATAYAQATSKIAATKQALAELFGNTQEGFLLQSLNTEEKYAYYQRQAEQLFAALAAATDPEVIDRLARQIDAAQNAAFGLLSPEQQTALSGEFISGSQRVEDLVNARLAAAGDLLDKNNASLREVIRDALAEFAADIKDVADQERETADINLEAARTPRTFRFIVDKYGDVEVANV